MTEFVQKGFEQLGIKVNVVEDTFAALLAKEDNGNFQILEGTGWGADYPDP
jgi:ABC-type oligopeptide transport system substrate-binding subunit